MTQYTKPSDLPVWAESGDKVQPSNAEIQTGWPNSTVPPSRQRFNWVLNWLAQGLRYFMQRGVAEWDATEDYPLYGLTQFSGLTYRSISGTSNTAQQPDVSPEFWERWGYSNTQIQPRVDLLVAVAVTTANVTLTAAQAEAGILNITGILTGNRSVIIPNASRRFILINNTTGAFTLGIKTASGSAELISQGSANAVICDGANNVMRASADLTAYAPLASPAFTGNPTAPTQTAGDSSTKLATTAFAANAGAEKIQSITAAVASNALTVTLNPVTMSFRSPTLSNGEPNPRAISSALSLVVPSGSTLGSISARQSRLVLLAIDNAGTVELAIVNIAGGNNLDETMLISTAAISAASNAANVIYSTTARAGVPFRVVGYIESTQTTAGTWATAPSTVQGYGGQALAAMSSFGHGQTYQNLTASRAYNVTYYNATGKPIEVTIHGGAGNISVFLNVNGNAEAGYGVGGLSGVTVPPGNYYIATSASSLSYWSELR